MTGAWRIAARLAYWPAGLALVLAGVWGVRTILGPWPAALVLAPTFTVVVLAGWSVVERRTFPEPAELRTPPAPLAQLDPGRTAALVDLADAYRAWQARQDSAASHAGRRGAA